jgi:S1-C subfamily serine protease
VSLDGRPIAGVGDLQRSLVGDLVGRSVDVVLERDGTMAEVAITPTELRV